MFEEKTYESILSDMLDRVPNSVDKRQGSIVYDALSPSAIELAQVYIDLNIVLNNAFADTASSDYLEKKCLEHNLTRNPASYAIQKGVFAGSEGIPLNVNIGDRFSVVNNNINFVVVEKISDGVFKLRCETLGVLGNISTGSLIPINYIYGLETSSLTEILIYAENEESDYDLRFRYYNKVRNNPNNANKAQYVEWAISYGGIGRVKVFSLWDGINTVKVSILNANNEIATSTLIEEFQEYLDPDISGLGEGQAPIGAICTVSTANYKDIIISSQITLASGFTLEQATLAAEIAINDHFTKDINYLESSIGYFKLASILSELPEIGSIVSISVNEGISDIVLQDEEIPNLLSLTLSV